MTISKKRLRFKAWLVVAKGYFFLLLALIASAFFMPAGLALLILAFFGVTIYISAAIGNIACPKCGQPFGVGMSLMGSVLVPNKCISCKESST